MAGTAVWRQILEVGAVCISSARTDLVCHESRVGLLVTAIEMEEGPPVAASGSDHQTTVSCAD